MRRFRRPSALRSRRGVAGALLLAAAALAPAPAAAQSLQLEAQADRDGVVVDAAFAWPRAEELLGTLRDGLDSRITFTIRILEGRPGLAGLLGDVRLAERAITRVAYFDLLERRFVVEEAGERRAWLDAEDFLAAFLAVRGLRVRGSLPRPPRSVSVAARVSFDPVRLDPPLTIVALAGAAATHTTPWVVRQLAVGEAGP